MSELDLKEIGQNVYQSSVKDGFVELFMALLLITAGFLFQSFFIVIFIALLVLYSQSILDKLKEHYTYPRIGKVELKTEEPKKLMLGIISFVLIIFLFFILLLLIFADITNSNDWYRLFPICFGLIMWGPSLDLVEKTGNKIYYLLGLVATVLGVVFAIIEFSEAKDGLTWYLVTLGILTLIIGLTLFASFIKNNPVIILEDEKSV